MTARSSGSLSVTVKWAPDSSSLNTASAIESVGPVGTGSSSATATVAASPGASATQ